MGLARWPVRAYICSGMRRSPLASLSLPVEPAASSLSGWSRGDPGFMGVTAIHQFCPFACLGCGLGLCRNHRCSRLSANPVFLLACRLADDDTLASLLYRSTAAI